MPIGRPFEKGNPGKPKGAISAKRKYAEKLAEAFTEDDLMEVVGALQSQALKGDPNAAHILLKYTIGLPKQTVAIEEVKDGFEKANDSASINTGVANLNGLAAGHGDDNGG
jgi:hypothetical protein